MIKETKNCAKHAVLKIMDVLCLVYLPLMMILKMRVQAYFLVGLIQLYLEMIFKQIFLLIFLSLVEVNSVRFDRLRVDLVFPGFYFVLYQFEKVAFTFMV